MSFRLRRKAALRASGLLGLTASAGLAGFLALQCSSTEDETVEIVTTCDSAKLDVTNTAEATVKVYLETGGELKQRATQLVDRFKKVCNAMNKDLGLPEGADVHAACNPIADRIANANNVAPTPDAGARPIWVSILFDDVCFADAKVEASCQDTCSGAAGCNAFGNCSAQVGSCAGTCKGTCARPGTPIDCLGACTGQCDLPSPDAGPEAGVPACGGECVGKCATPTWQARCSTGCATGFFGKCEGTCTGACDGVPYPGIPIEAGVPDGGVDAGDDGGDAGDGGVDAGVADAGATDAGTAPGSGICSGTCSGSCKGLASGSCRAPCAGDFSGGQCAGPGNCVGACIGTNIPCTTKCSGVCVTRDPQCTGTCRGGCEGTVQNPTCEGAFNCGPEAGTPGGNANAICRAVCKMKGVLAAQCGTRPADIRLAGDYKLYDALRTHIGDFVAIVRELNLVVANIGGVTQRTAGEFRSIGVVFDNARKCAEQGSTSYEEARVLVNEAVGASLVLRGQKF